MSAEHPEPTPGDPTPEAVNALGRIIDYLRQHPLARDTSRWIAQFWAEAPLEAVEAALSLLVARGFLRVNQRNGELLYSRNSELDWKQAQALIRELTRRP
jgi:hypothetical protein